MGRAARRRKGREPVGIDQSAVVRRARVTAAQARVETTGAALSRVKSALSGLPVARARLDAKQAELVRQARELGASWATVGACLNVSAQAARERYGKLEGVNR